MVLKRAGPAFVSNRDRKRAQRVEYHRQWDGRRLEAVLAKHKTRRKK